MNEKTLRIAFYGSIFVWLLAVIYWADPIKKKLIVDIRRWWGKDIDDAAAYYGISVRRIASIIAVESSGDENVDDGAASEIGLMQITDGAYRQWRDVYGGSYSDSWIGLPSANPRRNPRENIFIGAGYLKILYDQLGSLDLATRRYNASSYMSQAATDYLNRIRQFERQFFL